MEKPEGELFLAELLDLRAGDRRGDVLPLFAVALGLGLGDGGGFVSEAGADVGHHGGEFGVIE